MATAASRSARSLSFARARSSSAVARASRASSRRRDAASVSAALPTGGFVILDTALDDDLLAEGYARDAIRAVQDARKAADLDIADRISLVLTVPAADVAKVEQFRDLIAHETLATSFEVKEGAELIVEVVKA